MINRRIRNLRRAEEDSENELQTRAKKYDFSGGQIENIARKCDISSVLYGEDTLDEETLEEFCAEETPLRRNAPRIGFTS